jgi:hypothetical protein
MYEEPKWQRLTPGDGHRIAVTELHPPYFGATRCYWTAPGKYLIHATYSAHVRLKADDRKGEFVTLRAGPSRLPSSRRETCAGTDTADCPTSMVRRGAGRDFASAEILI